MSGREMKNRKIKRGPLLTIPMGLEIFLVLTLLLVLMGRHAYKTQLSGFEDFELQNYREMMELCLETGIKQIRLESIRAQQSGEPLDLESLNDRIGGVEFDPSLIDNDRRLHLKWDRSEFSMHDTSMYFLYLILRGDGKTLLIDGDSGLMKELDEEDIMAVNGRKAFLKGNQESWIPPAAEDENEGQEADAAGDGEGRVYYLAQVIPMDGPVAYGDHTVLFNHTEAGIGMVCRVDTTGIREGCRTRALQTTVTPFGILWGVVTILCILVHMSMRLLRSMQRVMRRFRIGEDDMLDEKSRSIFLPDRMKPREELTDLSESFYVMSGNLRQYRDSVENLRERYEPFVPAVLPALFNTDDVLKIAPGDTEYVTGSSLRLEFVYRDVPAPEKGDNSQTNTCPENTVVKRIPAIVAEIIEEKGGLITELDVNVVNAVFPEGSQPGEALDLIMALKEKESGLEDIVPTGETGSFEVKITGTQDRMAFDLERVSYRREGAGPEQ